MAGCGLSLLTVVCLLGLWQVTSSEGMLEGEGMERLIPGLNQSVGYKPRKETNLFVIFCLST